MLRYEINKENWCRFYSALDESDNEVHWFSENAVKRDLTSHIKYIYTKEKADLAIEKLKTVIKIDPILKAVVVKYDDYIFDMGRDQSQSNPLYMWNDSVEDFSIIERAIMLVDV